MKTIKTKDAIKIIMKKKKERTLIEHARLADWVDNRIFPPIRVIIFPVVALVRLYEWTYYGD
jgi:hypothetical protein